ncbi:MAG: diaminopimelate decarboxylase [Sediminibacterium sp.]|jgi:diaminopimelate decarboxylase|uniref:diaminopimelate decarboxylase n=1 Tax=Sediminibacterium sp. TaxID=1917865 RepID=UPI002ABB3C31|nr:diaminopimelate decarboxylase [Sediminibacterium sp.]MDZ4070505.1 diaminopimelate decarboxylase [Sediminibacterium sp.]
MSSFLSNEQLRNIATEFGTPVYVYNANRITEQFQQLKQAFNSDKVSFFYACKALTNVSILKHIKSIGCKVDCSSINEAKLAVHAGFPSGDILYTSNGIAFDEIEEAVTLGININIDSLSNLEKFGKKYGHSYPVGIRLRPNIMAGGNLKISTGHDTSKFGIPIEQLNDIVRIMQQYQIHIAGLHVHTGSEIKDVAVFMKVTDVFFELVPHFPELQFLDLGGGFKVPYQDGEEGTDIQLLAKEILAFEQKIEQTYQRSFQVWFEPGKYLVSEAGYLITSVNVLKETSATIFVGVNSGFNHLIRPMFYEAYHRIRNISNEKGTEKNYTITGNICETDTFAWERPMNEIREGDILVFDNAGAYGFEMASNFNSRYRPAEVMVKDGKPYLIRKREVFEDLLRNLVEPF